MSKKKDFEELLLEANTPLKRHKKHKKHKKEKSDDNKRPQSILVTDSSMDTTNDTVDVEELCVVEMPSTSDQQNASDSSFVEMSAAEKLKSQSALNPSPPLKTTLQTTSTALIATAKVNKKKRTRRGSGTSSEEERWLDAIESGKLEQVDDELKKIKDPKLMTARQRAMYERSIDKDPSPSVDALLALPTGYKEKVLTAEAIQKAQLKSQKRKQLADEKREKDKRKTMDRLLKKQESKAGKVNKNKPMKVTVPVISYRDSISTGASLSFPENVDLPLLPQIEREPPKPIVCAICNDHTKRYSCSKTNVPLCSFKCYKINLDSVRQTVC